MLECQAKWQARFESPALRRGRGRGRGRSRSQSKAKSKSSPSSASSSEQSKSKGDGNDGSANDSDGDALLEALRGQKLAGKRTARRAQQVRAYLDARDRNHADDIFASATENRTPGGTARLAQGIASSPWTSRRSSGSGMDLALPSPSVFANMIFEDSASDNDNNGASDSDSASGDSSGSEDSEEEDDGDGDGDHAASKTNPSRRSAVAVCQPSPLVLRVVDRNQFDGYIKRTQSMARKVGLHFS